MKRIVLFLATNFAILIVLSITLRLLGVESLLDKQGVDLDLNSLVIFATVFGMGGAFISLALSKWTAKRLTGARVIDKPSSETESWLVDTVRRQARVAGIGIPEVAIYRTAESDGESPSFPDFRTTMQVDGWIPTE